MSQDAQDSTPRRPVAADVAPVLEILHYRQDQSGCLREDDLADAARAAGLSPAELYSAITAYPRFRIEPGTGAPAVCTGPACLMHGAARVQRAFAGASEAHCLGLCDQPVALLTSDGPRVACEATGSELRSPQAPLPSIGVPNSAFFGSDDPLDAVRAALRRPPEEIIAMVTESGLQGRGGAAFPAGRKWAMVRASPGDRKFVVCNADESEPGSFKDRYILDHQPGRLLAGMILAGHAVGAEAGIVYIRYEYRRQYERLLQEIARLRGEGFLGDDFDIVVRRGAGAYICGEETALLNSLEGKRPIPRDRPPYPVERGLFGAPTVVQNVETLAAVPAIVALGPAWFRDAGSPKLYCVSGDVPSPGVFELPMTVTVRQLLDLAGAPVEGVKAFTLGGLSGGLLSGSHIDVQLDWEGPRRYGAYLGSGGIIVMGDSRCTVRFARETMRFFAGESCGKCFPCRIGTTRLRERLEAAVHFGSTRPGEMDEIVDVLLTGSACGLGPAAAILTRHLLAHFGEELRAHLEEGRCPAGECEI